MKQQSMLLVQESLLHFKFDSEFVKRFYARIFEIAPQARALFPSDMEGQEHKFQSSFELFLKGTKDLEKMRASINNLGAYHAEKNIKSEHFPIFCEAIFATLREELGELFTPEMANAWEEYINKIVEYMDEGINRRNNKQTKIDSDNESKIEIAGDRNIIQEFKDAEAILSGHFILSSGLRSPTYLQCARVMMDARRGERLCSALALKVREWMQASGKKIDAIVAPAMGGVVVGYEMGRQLEIDTMFCERVEGNFTLRRGFEVKEGQKILIVEDVVTTGKSSMEAASCIESLGAKPVAVASLIDRRSNNDVSLTMPLISLLKLDVPTYKPEELPPELQNITAVKPGSRDLKKTAW